MRKIYFLSIVMIFAAFYSAAHAEIMRYEFSGTATLDDALNQVGETGDVYDFSGAFSFDTNDIEYMQENDLQYHIVRTKSFTLNMGEYKLWNDAATFMWDGNTALAGGMGGSSDIPLPPVYWVEIWARFDIVDPLLMSGFSGGHLDALCGATEYPYDSVEFLGPIDQFSKTPVPEPATILLLGIGMSAIAIKRNFLKIKNKRNYL